MKGKSYTQEWMISLELFKVLEKIEQDLRTLVMRTESGSKKQQIVQQIRRQIQKIRQQIPEIPLKERRAWVENQLKQIYRQLGEIQYRMKFGSRVY